MSAMSNSRIIFEKRTVYVVCVINNVINYSIDNMVLVSLNLNDYHMPTGIVSVKRKRLQNVGFHD